MAHRRRRLLDPLAQVSERSTGLPAWAVLPTLIAGVSLLVGVWGYYWDVSIHIDQGRDQGAFGNPAHWFIIVGLDGIAFAGILALFLGDARGGSSVRLTERWSVPVGELTPLGRLMVRGSDLGLAGAFLIGLSTLQVEFDYGVPQFRLLEHPALIAVAASIALVTARIRVGRGGALAAVAFFYVVRIALAVGVDAFDRIDLHAALYLGSAVLVELVAVVVPTLGQCASAPSPASGSAPSGSRRSGCGHESRCPSGGAATSCPRPSPWSPWPAWGPGSSAG